MRGQAHELLEPQRVDQSALEPVYRGLPQCLKGLAGRREGHKQCPRQWKKSTMPTAKSACWTFVSRRVSEPIRASTPLAHSRRADSVVAGSMLLLAAPALLIVHLVSVQLFC